MPDQTKTDAADLILLNVEQSALPEEDKAAFAEAERRAAEGSYDASNKTVREIIEEQRKTAG